MYVRRPRILFQRCYLVKTTFLLTVALIPLRRLEPVADSVTEFDESTSTFYDICKVKSVRGQEPDIEFLVEWTQESTLASHLAKS